MQAKIRLITESKKPKIAIVYISISFDEDLKLSKTD
jgi:hypothetical protein